MRHFMMLTTMLAGAAALTGCSKEAQHDASAEPAAQPATKGVVREETPVAATGAPAAPVATPLQTQPGPKGTQVALNKVAVVGDIMTVALTYSGGECCIYTPLDKVSVIDDTTSQRISVLKDNAGNWMAAPMFSNDKDVRIDPTKSAQVWFKFPAPPATSRTVSIAIPDVAPFDGVAVTH